MSNENIQNKTDKGLNISHTKETSDKNTLDRFAKIIYYTPWGRSLTRVLFSSAFTLLFLTLPIYLVKALPEFAQSKKYNEYPVPTIIITTSLLLGVLGGLSTLAGIQSLTESE